MVNCCVPGCVNYSAKSNGISYHKLPRDAPRRKAWLERMRRTNVPPLENCFCCSEHFSAESFEVNLRSQITGVKCKRRLKEDAIPSEFCFRPPTKMPRLSSCCKLVLRLLNNELTKQTQRSKCSTFSTFSMLIPAATHLRGGP